MHTNSGMKKSSIQSIKRQIENIEQVGFLEDCWIAQYTPAGSAKGKGVYWHIRSRKQLFGGKKSKHLKATELEHYQQLVSNGRTRKKLIQQLKTLTTTSIGSYSALLSSASNEWYTPPVYISLAREVMGGIDLDPASSDTPQSWIKAERYYTVHDNGLFLPWQGRIWLNPPYGSHTSLWTEKAVQDYKKGVVEQAILLLKPAVGTRWYQTLSAQFPECRTHKRIGFLNKYQQVQSSPVHGNSFFYIGSRLELFKSVFSTIGTVSIPWF